MKFSCESNIFYILLLFCVCWPEVFCELVVNTNNFYFKINPAKQDVEEGKSMRLECAVHPNYNIVYWWQRDSHDIEMDGDRRTLESGSNLLVQHADRDLDRGTYNCVAKNRTSVYTSMSHKALISVFWMEPKLSIDLVKPATMSDIVLGSEVKLRCVVRSDPAVEANRIKWFYNGVRLRSDMKVLDDGTLVIVSFQQYHMGTFHCRVFHAAGRLESKPPFVIAFAGSPPKQIDLSRVSFVRYVKLNDHLKLVCPNITGGGANAMAFWGYMTHLGKPFKPLNDMPSVAVDNSNSFEVNIRNAQEKHANLYICEVKKSPGAATGQQFFIQVEIAAIYPLKRSQFSPRRENNLPYIVQQGEDFALRFYIDLTPSHSYLVERIPNPPPKIEWLNSRNQTIPNWSGGIDSESEAPRVHVLYGRHLIIRNSGEEDTGLYRIEVSNLAGRETLNFNIVTTFPPAFSHKNPTRIEKDEGENVYLKCPVGRRSPAGTSKIVWKKDGVKVPLRNRQSSVRTYKDGEEMEILSADVGRTGDYTCSIRTRGFEQAQDSPVISVLVKGKLRFVNKIQSKFLEVELQGRLPCKVEGYGRLTTNWMRSDPSGNLMPIQLPNQVESGTLIFQYVQKADAGTYVCLVTSSYKSRKIQMTVNVVVGESPKILHMSANQTVRVGTNVTFNCTASGDPKPVISWIQKNNQDLSTFTYNSSSQAGRGSILAQAQAYQVLGNGSLVIRRVRLGDEAMYFCVGANSHTIQTRQGVHLKVLTKLEWDDIQRGEGINSSMIKTIAIVVSCAVAYLGLIIGLTIFCSMRMIRNRRKRAQLAKTRENGQLMTHVNGQHVMPTLPPPNYHHNNHSYPPSSSHPHSHTNGRMMDGESQQLLSDLAPPPPPTPMDSRSHLSGNTSSANSISMYSRSHLSGASAGMLAGMYPSSNSPSDRLRYPRHELQTEGMLGKGEFGDVFLARARTSQSLVVVKALMSRERAHADEFNRQLNMFAKLSHDYVSQLLGICSEMEPQFMILEYCDWGDLKQFLRCMRQERSNSRIPPLTQTQKITMCSQVAMGMEHLTNYQCIHKDLAARNVLLTQDMDLKISSLGLSRDVYANEYFPHHDRLVPIRWLSMEALLRDVYSAKSDVWAFGVFVFEVFSMAELPYCHTTDHELVQVAKKNGLKPEIPAKCPTELVSLLERCFADEPCDRPSFSEISVIMGDLTVDVDV